MHISQYIDTYYPTLDGVTLTVSNYAKWLNTKDDTCDVITVKNGNGKDVFDYTVHRFTSIPIVPKRGYWLSIPFIDRRLINQLKHEKTDVIHAHSPFIIGRLGLKMAKQQHIPIVATFHSKLYDDFYAITKSKFISKLLLNNVIRFYNNVDFVWTVNASTVDTLRSYGYKGKVEIMPNGTDLETPSNPEILIEKVMKTFEIPDDNDIFLFVGQHIWQKNIRLIFEALHLYKRVNPKFTLLMVGTGNIIDDLKELARSLDIDRNIIFTGKIADRSLLTGIYLASNLFLFPSRYDNAPLVIREAAVCKLPAVVVKGTGSSEGIINNENGFLCDENSQSLCDSIFNAMADKERLKTIGINASNTVPISWENVSKLVYKKYEEIIDNYNK